MEKEKLLEEIEKLRKDVQFHKEWEEFYERELHQNLMKAREVYKNVGGDKEKLYNMDEQKILTEIEKMFKGE